MVHKYCVIKIFYIPPVHKLHFYHLLSFFLVCMRSNQGYALMYNILSKYLKSCRELTARNCFMM